jgi:hypothetical protein
MTCVLQGIDSYNLIIVLQRVAVLNNVGVREMNKGNFEDAATSFRIALSAMKHENGTDDIKRISQQSTLEICHQNVQLLQTHESCINYPALTKVIDVSFNEADSICLKDVPDFENPELFSFLINTQDFEFFDLSATDLICSVIMYNMAVSHFLASYQIRSDNLMMMKVRACQKVLELAIQILDMTNHS